MAPRLQLGRRQRKGEQTDGAVAAGSCTRAQRGSCARASPPQCILAHVASWRTFLQFWLQPAVWRNCQILILHQATRKLLAMRKVNTGSFCALLPPCLLQPGSSRDAVAGQPPTRHSRTTFVARMPKEHKKKKVGSMKERKRRQRKEEEEDSTDGDTSSSTAANPSRLKRRLKRSLQVAEQKTAQWSQHLRSAIQAAASQPQEAVETASTAQIPLQGLTSSSSTGRPLGEQLVAAIQAMQQQLAEQEQLANNFQQQLADRQAQHEKELEKHQELQRKQQQELQQKHQQELQLLQQQVALQQQQQQQLGQPQPQAHVWALPVRRPAAMPTPAMMPVVGHAAVEQQESPNLLPCPLYTSDAADDSTPVTLGGRRHDQKNKDSTIKKDTKHKR